MKTRDLHKVSRLCVIFAITVSLNIGFLPVEGLASSPTPDSYHYSFTVDEDGFTRAMVNFKSFKERGSSWVFVPKFSNWSRPVVSSGHISKHEVVETESVVDTKYYFYQVFRFWFVSDKSFRMSVQFNMSVGALIIEPRGMFFSPQIGFQEGSRGEAEVFFPHNSRVVEAVAIGRGGNYKPTERELNYVAFDLHENLIRLQIEFKTSITTPALSKLKQGIFTFQTVKRYEKHASNVLSLFSGVYNDFVDLFNVTLESVNVQFFISEFHTFLSIGGYVPFTGGRMGDIHINIFFIRAVEGVLEVIALHELIHQFLWKAGLSPSDLLWFHEGMAQYVSIEIADRLGYEGVQSERDKLEKGASKFIEQYGENFHFLQQWKPEPQPTNIATYYIASHYVVSRLAGKYGGLNYYRRFFRLMKGGQIKDNNVLAYHLSLASDTSVAQALKRWGFNIVDLYAPPTYEAERIIHDLNPILQPYKFLAEYLYKQALIRFEKGDAEKANQYLAAAIFIAKFAPTLTVATMGAILIAIIYTIERQRASHFRSVV
ncbi:MAG: hypothetical protein AOA65_0075 [Candidatus Bathyarchaeota archaeon BA1]|nr:MAG: hypothetical protein AOA65_0075 [Candidatus Bathyarchaeota archaeon BA1]